MRNQDVESGSWVWDQKADWLAIHLNREFEAGFEASHRSITYADQPQPQPQQQEGRRATRSASRAMQGGGGGESRGIKRERGDSSEDDDTADMAIKQEERSEASRYGQLHGTEVPGLPLSPAEDATI